ncbi:hypothetical protein HNY73_016522 [Argiope bruennichi]|uniref:Uncharacterized protein n=1 Tax=Argiope bruennichi TaxID=94029 RepID=A0A8T0EKF0_ARGBR|nr:hypothetical protein HNY73_016522 [Argiope bruennichi]
MPLIHSIDRCYGRDHNAQSQTTPTHTSPSCHPHFPPSDTTFNPNPLPPPLVIFETVDIQYLQNIIIRMIRYLTCIRFIGYASTHIINLYTHPRHTFKASFSSPCFSHTAILAYFMTCISNTIVSQHSFFPITSSPRTNKTPIHACPRQQSNPSTSFMPTPTAKSLHFMHAPPTPNILTSCIPRQQPNPSLLHCPRQQQILLHALAHATTQHNRSLHGIAHANQASTPPHFMPLPPKAHTPLTAWSFAHANSPAPFKSVFPHQNPDASVSLTFTSS